VCTDRNVATLQPVLAGIAKREALAKLTTCSVSTIDETIESMTKTVLDTIAQSSPAGDEKTSEDGTNSRVAVFIYSFSEIVLNYGLNASTKFLKSIKAIPTVYNLVATMHSTLHATRSISYMQALFDVTVLVDPNNGTMGDDVMAEIQSVRKSPGTGKVYEDQELFGVRGVYLYPLKGRKVLEDEGRHGVAGGGDSDAVSGVADVLSAVNILDNNVKDPLKDPLKGPLKESTKGSKDGDQAVRDGVQGDKGQGDGNTCNRNVGYNVQRLVTFDSTDPEFDEDSDPDNDLDL
jgi:hypothetical protein